MTINSQTASSCKSDWYRGQKSKLKSFWMDGRGVGVGDEAAAAAGFVHAAGADRDAFFGFKGAL